MADTHQEGAGTGADFDLSQFYQIFFEEAGENLDQMEQMLLDLDLDAANDEELNGIFRCAHSIKGGAATFGFADVAELTHQMESLLDRLRRHELQVIAPMVDVLLESADASRSLLARHQAGGQGEAMSTQDLVRRISTLAAGGVPRLIPSSAEKRFQLSAQDVAQHWTPATQGVLVASPSNPTGTSIDHGELAELLAQVRARDGFAIVDEIYLGLSYEGQPRSALTLDDDVIVINSFSKYFHMTGWRLGWMIVPQDMVAPVEKIAASLAICAPTLAQHAALACFTPAAMKTFEHRREAFKQRRDYLLPEFERLGIQVPVKPDGAFYIYADIANLGMDSAAFSQRLLLEAGVAAVPGLDFGPAHGRHTMRFSYATGLDRLEEAVARMGSLLRR